MTPIAKSYWGPARCHGIVIAMQNHISIVIPTRNEAGNIGRLLDALAAEESPHDVIVVDGGSSDDTAAIAATRGVRVLAAAGGRGNQLRLGAAATEGDILWFLHGDSRVAAGSLGAIRDTMDRQSDAVGGNFRLLFDGGDGFSAWLDSFYAWLRRNGFYYGDSGIFVRRVVYDRMGGMPTHALMEDYAFVRRLEALGPTICIDQPALVTSSRRFLGRRPTGIVAGWLLIHALYHCGVAPRRLAWIYDRLLRPRTAVS